MSRWILDTDHVSLFLRNYSQVSQKINEHGADVAITIVTVQELFNGWIVRINVATDVADLVRLYGKLNRTIDFCKRVPVMEFDSIAGDRYHYLINKVPALAKKRLQKDMRIAAIALSKSATVVTRNHRDFSLVPGLQIEDWSK